MEFARRRRKFLAIMVMGAKFRSDFSDFLPKKSEFRSLKWPEIGSTSDLDSNREWDKVESRNTVEVSFYIRLNLQNKK